MPKKNQAVESLREYLQELPVSRAVGGVNKRSLGKSQRLESALSSEFKPKEIAEALGIRTQKWVALRRGIREGRVASPELGTLLEGTRAEVTTKPKIEPVDFLGYKPDTGNRRVKIKSEATISEREQWIKKNSPWARDLKPAGFMDKKSALNWWGNAGAGSQYFWIVKKRDARGRFRYHVYDMRTPNELENKGNVSGTLRAVKLRDGKKSTLGHKKSSSTKGTRTRR